MTANNTASQLIEALKNQDNPEREILTALDAVEDLQTFLDQVSEQCEETASVVEEFIYG